MAIDIITGFNSASRESLDKRSGPYASLADAKAALDTNERFVGLKVLVISNSTTDGAGNYIAGDLTEYVFDGGITDNDLVEVIILNSDLTDHINDTNNPHSVTAAQLNLDNVDNTSDADKPISTATQDALDLKANQTGLNTHINDTNNPHSVTADQIGLANVDNTSDADKPISTATQNALDTKPSSSDFDNIVKLTQGQYNALTPDANTLYIITL